MPIVTDPKISRNVPACIRRNLLDHRFGSLVVVGFVRQRRASARCVQSIWLARCDCGNYTEIQSGCLTRQDRPVRHCAGCGHKYKGGRSLMAVPEYTTWSDLRRRGILCDVWANSFEAFMAYVGNRPSAKHRMWRADWERPHEPGNSFWKTREETRRERNRINVAAYMASIGDDSETLRKRLESVSRQRLFQLREAARKK